MLKITSFVVNLFQGQLTSFRRSLKAFFLSANVMKHSLYFDKVEGRNCHHEQFYFFLSCTICGFMQYTDDSLLVSDYF